MALDTKVLATKDYIAKEIAGGVLTLDDWGICYYVDGQGSLADDLDTINTGIEGQFLIIMADGVILTIKHGTGNIQLSSGDDFPLGAESQILLVFDGTNWRDIQSAALTDYVAKSLMDADTVLTATSDNTPVATAMAEQTVLGRITGGHPAALTVAEMLTLLFGAAMPANVEITLHAALDDGEYSGLVEAGIAGATLAVGNSIYQAVGDDRWELTDASAEATSFAKMGICVLAAANDGDATKILLLGKCRFNAAFPTFTKYAPVFLSETPGELTNTKPTTSGSITRIMGYGNTGDELFVTPEADWIEHV